MKMLTRLMSVGAVLAFGSVSLAGGWPSPDALKPVYYGTGSSPVRHYSYRSGYSGAVQPAPVVVNTAPVRSVVSPSWNSARAHVSAPEGHLEYARARQHIRGW